VRFENVIAWDNEDVGQRMVIEMRYIGKNLSVNHYKWKGRFTKPEVQVWMEDLASIIQIAAGHNRTMLKQHDFVPPISVRIDGFFRDKRHPDLSNLNKVVLDAVQQGLGINDKHFRAQDGYVAVAKEHTQPSLRITIEQIKEVSR